MMKSFFDVIHDALSNDRLVVFAGAGVSVDPPSSLPGFEDLVKKIGKEASYPRENNHEPADQFLGRLHSRGVEVHKLAARFLNLDGSEPNSLHCGLLKLFRSSEKVRIVTTNFDVHFEAAAKKLKERGHFNCTPRIYQAPALPVGSSFNGIVHLHGVLADYVDMVLTDRDFGRAYLVEGWALRFLNEMFREYVVLFIGYGHSDVVMNYFAKALPKKFRTNRFAITYNENDAEWWRLGIRTEAYQTSQKLCNAVGEFAENVSRSTEDRRDLLKSISQRDPKQNSDFEKRVLDFALKHESSTSIFAEFAKHPSWPDWLADKEYLSALFKQSDLLPREKTLAKWLADNYAIEHPDVLFSLANKNKFSLNPVLWNLISIHLRRSGSKISDPLAWRRWVMAYLSFASHSHNHWVLMDLANQSCERKMVDLSLKIFLLMGKYGFKINYGSLSNTHVKDSQEKDVSVQWTRHSKYWHINQIWKNCLEPQLESVAEAVVDGIYSQINYYHRVEIAWKKQDTLLEFLWERKAIDEHFQNRLYRTFDMPVTAMRDALVWLLKKRPVKAYDWIKRLITSDVPFLRRLAIYIMRMHPRKSADEFLKCLSKTDSKCSFFQGSLSKFVADLPEWQSREQPEFCNWPDVSSGAKKVPDAVEGLLARPPSEPLIKEMLNLKAESVENLSRDDRLVSLRRACEQNAAWGIYFAKLLSRCSLENDLWREVLAGLNVADIQRDDWRELLKLISETKLQSEHTSAIASLLKTSLYSGRKTCALEFLDDANEVALDIWLSNEPTFVDQTEKINWYGKALDDPTGKVVDFWLSGLWLSLAGKEPDSREFPIHYRKWFEMALDDVTFKGAIARFLLVRNGVSFLRLDENWTRKHLIPLLIDIEPLRFLPAWHGILEINNIPSDFADEIRPGVFKVLNRLNELSDMRNSFFEFYAVFVAVHNDNSKEALIPAMFEHTNEIERQIFTEQIHSVLQDWRKNYKREIQNLWNRWLFEYWKDRWELGLPSPLSRQEVTTMLDWLPFLEDSYAEAISSIKSSATVIKDFSLADRLGEFGLVERYPEATANLLIHLCREDIHGKRPYMNHELCKIAFLLSQHSKEIDKDLKIKVNDHLIKIELPDLDQISSPDH